MVPDMDEVIFYSTGCPKCSVLKKKLDGKHIEYVENNSVEDMLAMGFDALPVLEVNGKIMEFKESIDWVNQK